MKPVRFLLALLILLIAAEAVAQQSGGSFGGGGFGAPPNAPSPASGGNGTDLFSVLPYFLYGGGGTAGLVILGLVVLVPLLTRYMRQNASRQGLSGALNGSSAALKVQLMLIEGEEVKTALRTVASQGDTTHASGLTNMVRESVLTVLRHPERWVYGTVEMAGGSDAQSSQRVSSWATGARAAYNVETTRNQGRLETQPHTAQLGGTYCMVTFAVAARDMLLPHVTPPVETTEVRSALEAVAGVTPENLVAAQVVWTPDAPGEFLTEDAALRLFPTLYRL